MVALGEVVQDPLTCRSTPTAASVAAAPAADRADKDRASAGASAQRTAAVARVDAVGALTGDGVTARGRQPAAEEGGASGSGVVGERAGALCRPSPATNRRLSSPSTPLALATDAAVAAAAALARRGPPAEHAPAASWWPLRPWPAVGEKNLQAAGRPSTPAAAAATIATAAAATDTAAADTAAAEAATVDVATTTAATAVGAALTAVVATVEP